MADYLLREYAPGDFPGLIRLWNQVFGDPPELISAFLNGLSSYGTGAVAELKGRIAGAAYAIDGMYIRDPLGGERRCCYIYAVAVSPEHRHQGLGEALSRKAAELSRERGSQLISTLPAEESLYPWYRKILGLSCALHRRSFSVKAGSLLPCREVSGREYMALREKLLKALPHMRPNPELMDFAALFYRSFGGGLYLCGDALCAAYGDGELVIRELIAPENVSPADAAASLAAFLRREKARYYLPSSTGEAYISASPGSLPENLVWNLSFD